jgi:pimeloyl-ACP methyl ester carboxylesterase
MARDVVGLLDELKIARASVVGWSDGGIIGLDLAIHHRERLNKLFAFAANYDPSGLTDDLDKNAVFNHFIEQAGQAYQRISPTPTEYPAFNQAIHQMWDSEPHYTRGELQAITTPTAIADGEYDEAIKRSHTEEMARLIPHAQLIILPQTSHFAMLQNPSRFNQAVLDFLTH